MKGNREKRRENKVEEEDEEEEEGEEEMSNTARTIKLLWPIDSAMVHSSDCFHGAMCCLSPDPCTQFDFHWWFCCL